MTTYGTEGTRVVAYTYGAAIHCTEHATATYGRDRLGYVPESARDSEGNGIGAVFTSDLDVDGATVESCDDNPRETVCLCCGMIDATRAIGAPCWNCATDWHVWDGAL